MSYAVGELAKLAGVSVRTLHHYDHIGLLCPSARSAAGYRRYAARDVLRLHRILVYRELGFDLGRIATILDDPAVDALEHLRRQRSLLQEQLERLHHMIEGVEAMMKANRTGIDLTPEEMREVFGAFNPAEHAAEAEERWGGSAAYGESQRRVAQYGREQWLQIRAEADRISDDLASAMRAGVAATDPAAMDLAEAHRRHISRWYYDCSHAVHRGLGEMYVADARFAAHYDERAPGLSAYLRDAINANADRGA